MQFYFAAVFVQPNKFHGHHDTPPTFLIGVSFEKKNTVGPCCLWRIKIYRRALVATTLFQLYKHKTVTFRRGVKILHSTHYMQQALISEQ